MAWWLFGKKDKKGGRGRSKTAKSLDKSATTDERDNLQSRGSTAADGGGTSNAEARTAIQRSFTAPATARHSEDRVTPGDAEEQPAPAPRESYEEITALPGAPQYHEFDSGPHLRSIDQMRSQSTKTRRLPLEPATLRPSKKSTKRQDSRAREAGIRAMTQPIPIPESRAASIRPRESKRSLNRPGESVVSLPRAGSVRSVATSKHEYHKFDVGIIDVFSARPKIRHSLQQPTSTLPSRSASRRTTRSFSRPDSRADQDDDDALSMIDDLADEYDATAIRKLMERDKRRVMQKVQLQEEKARRRLERQARREREAAGISSDPGEESSRGAFQGLGLANVGIGPSSPVAARRPSPKADQDQDEGQEEASHAPETLVEPELAASEPAAAAAAAAAEEEEKMPGTAVKHSPPAPAMQTGTSPPSSPGTRPHSAASQAQDVHRSIDDVAESPTSEPKRRSSVLSNKPASAIAALFRRNKRNSQTEATTAGASEPEGTFSNTSRESMPRQAVPAHLREQPSLTGALSSMVPKRTLSKFREHLHESEPREALPADAAERINEAQADEAFANAPLSTSLASIGSEGSWLSGSRPPRKRESRGTVSTPVPVDERPETSESDEVWVDAQPTVARQSITPQDILQEEAPTTAATTPQNEIDEPLGSGLRAGDVAQKPVLMQRSNSAKSREGLLTTIANQDAASSAHVTDSSSGTPGEHSDGMSSPYEARVEEITSFRSVTHARTVSSGSAKLLDIPARSESQRKREQASNSRPTSPVATKK